MFEQIVQNVRMLEADDLGIGVKDQAKSSHASSAPDAPLIPADDPMVQEIARLAGVYGGVILSGSPGTSKSYYASAAAERIAGDKNRVRFVQFHASYQYEDFMLGFTPTTSGFEVKEGPFLQLAKSAIRDPSYTYVLVIDELSRADVGRVFGEALTYVETTKRELPFTIASGEEIKVPENLVLLATMNPFDRGVDEVDAAFERRFAKISMDPDRDLLKAILESNEMDEELQRRVISWFDRINGHAQSNPAAAVGHAYFSTAIDEKTLSDIWNYQLKYLVSRAFRRDENTRSAIETGWQYIIEPPDPS
ncbi:McrB family protein [Brevibacterium sp. K72]|uniref:McrB family protein n=1 Tax=Brevibacterium sp. K72 TaxID=3390729 RepID=UPI003D2FD988